MVSNRAFTLLIARLSKLGGMTTSPCISGLIVTLRLFDWYPVEVIAPLIAASQ